MRKNKMSAKRCEICGALYDVVHGYADISLYNNTKVHDEDNYYEGNRYNICETCARKILDVINLLIKGE